MQKSKWTKARNSNGRWVRGDGYFVLWGKQPGGWASLKDLLLAVFLVNAFIGTMKGEELATIMQPSAIVYVQEQRIMPAAAQEVVPEVKPQETAKSSEIDGIVDKVYTLESSRGKHDSCRAKGLYNGYGYGQNKTSWLCFDSPDEPREKVAKWFTKELARRSLAEALCGYNLGFQSENLKDCMSKSEEYPYYRNYLKL